MTRHAPARRPGPAPFDRPDRRRARSFPRVLVVVLGAAAGLLFIVTGVALAYFMTTDSSHPAQAVAATLSAPTGGAQNGTATPTSVPITWTAPGGYNATGYTVLRCSGSSCTPTAITSGNCSGTITATSCTDTDTALVAGTPYTYEVEAHLNNWVSTPGGSFTASTTPVTKLVFTQPAPGQSFQAKGTGTFSVSVSIEDANGNVATHDSSDTVTLAIASGHNPGGGTLSCNGTGSSGLTASASSGVASFTCAITKVGSGYELTASSATNTSLTDPAPSNSFAITAGTPTALVFTLPLSGQSYQAKGTGTFSVSVSIEDANGNVATHDSSDTVTLAIASGHNPGGGTLSCNGTGAGGLTATASSGVASFTCAITKVGSGYELTASSATNTSLTDPAPSNSFTITAGSPSQVIANSGGGQSATADAAFTNPLAVTVEDANGNPVSGVSVTFAGPSTGASVTFASTGCTSNSPTSQCVVTTGTSGQATSSSFTANGALGSYTISATPGSGTGSASFSESNVATAITSVVAANGSGGTVGELNAGDTITITFSGPINAHSVCSAWTNGSSGTAESTGSQITVTNTGTGDNALSFSTAPSACTTFAFGTIDLGSGGYVTGPGGSNKPVTFGNSSIAYNNVTHALTITLGAAGNNGGNLNQVTKSALTLTLSTGVADIAGNAVSGSPFTTASVQQF